MHDLRFALRQLTKSPGFSAAVVISLALGIGANAAVWCWLRHLVLRPLPGVAHQQEIVVLLSNQGSGCVSTDDLRDIGTLTDVFAGTAASQSTPAALTIDDQLYWIEGQVVSANFFDLLGVKPLHGRVFLPDEDQKPGGNPVLVISERLWRQRFGADPTAVGRTVDLNRHRFTIVGVVPSQFLGTTPPSAFDFWAPRSMIVEVRNQRVEGRSARGWHNFARLQPGRTIPQAQAAVAALDVHLAATYPRSNTEITHRVLPYSQCPWGAQTVMSPVLRLLLAVSAGVLLIVTANVANLLLARAANRRKEIAIRLAAGAGRGRLIRQLLTESLLLALIGGLAGLLVASWAIDSIPLFVPAEIPPGVMLDYSLDGSTVGFALLLTLGCGLAFGLAPAWQASRTNLQDALKEGGRSSSAGATHRRLRNGLVVAEVALALVLLVAATLCLKGLGRAQQVNLGLEPDHVLLGRLQIGMHGYTPETGKIFYRDLRERLTALPGVEEVALASWFPLGMSGCKGWDAKVEGYVRPPGEDTTYEYAIISPRYFATMGIPLVAGRDFAESDDATAQPVAIVNEAFARRFWPGLDPIGRRFRTGGILRTIVGMVPTAKYNRLNEPAWCFFYLPYQQGVPDLDLGVCLRTTAEPAAFAPTLRDAVHAQDPGVELLHVMPMNDYIMVMFTQRMASTLLSMLGGVALVLAAMGVYAVMAYAVSQRTQEFGVRLALGATHGQVLGLVVRDGLELAALGVAVGLLLATATTRLLASFLHGVSPFDPATFLGVALLLTLIAVLACWVPARRATRVDPINALRAE